MWCNQIISRAAYDGCAKMLNQSQEASCKKDTIITDISATDNGDDINSLRANAILGGATGNPYFKRTVTSIL